ncbi:MAG: metallophosphoesterase, partial [Planctomycetota bacterium]
MIDWWRVILLVLALGGHFAVMLAAYNRFNALGIDRRIIKRVTKVMFAFTLALPLWFVVFHAVEVSGWMWSQSDASVAIGWQLYGLAVMILSLAMLVPFIITRPLFGWHWVR